MCPISVQITCLSHLLFYWSSEGKNELLSFELSPGLKYLFCSVGPARHLRTPVWVRRCWYRAFHVLSWGSSVQRFLLINPKDRLALLEIDEMCSDHFNLLLTVIPRYEAESTCSRLDPQEKYDRWGGLCLFEMQMMLHLEGLNRICHSCCQISSLLRSSWRLSQSESSTTTPYKRVSSANSLTVWQVIDVC